MKRIRSTIIALLIAIMLLSSSCGGSNGSASGSELYTVIPCMSAELPDDTSFDGIDVKFESINISGDRSVITLSVTNNKDVIVSCDPWHSVELYEAGEWISCEKEGNEFGTLEKGIGIGATVSVEYEIGRYNDITSPGKYAFKTNFYSDATGARDKTEAEFEFNVKPIEVLVEVKDYTYDGLSASFDLTWKNDTDSMIYLSDRYSLQYESSDGWADCDVGELGFNESIISVKSGEKLDRSYTLGDYYLIENYGNYRMILEFHSASDENNGSGQVVIEFTLPLLLDYISS